MDIKNRKTALSDDSILYQKREEASDKEKFRNLDRKGKFQFFVDYYLLKVVFLIFILAIGGNLIYNMVFRREETILTVSFIGSPYFENSDQLSEDLRSLYELTSANQEIYCTHYNLDDYNQQIAFTARSAAKEVDIILMDREQFDRYSEQEMFVDLSEVLDPGLYQELEDQILTGRPVDLDVHGDIESYGTEYPMVIDVTANPFLAKYSSFKGELFLGISSNSHRMENCLQFIEMIFSAN